jgi:hypothetical protein
MAHIKTKARYEEIRDLVIYVIVSPIDKRCYVGKTRKHTVGNHYKDHNILRNQSTKQLFMDAKAHARKPKMYLLEELQTVDADAFQHCVAWTKYFIEHGFRSLASDKVNRYASDLLSDTRKIYDEIRDRALGTVLCDERILEPKERVERKPKDKALAPADTTVITFRVAKSDAEKIQEAAEKRGWNLSEYCRAAAVDGCIVHVDFSPLIQYTRQISGMRDMLMKLIDTIHETGNYYPQDLENVQKMVDAVAVHAEKIRLEMTGTLRKAKKEISAAKRAL